MKYLEVLLIRSWLLALVFVASSSSAQVFDSGSTGTMGALVVSGNMTIAIPIDGVLNYTTVIVEESASLNFVPNAGNTPVFILASGDVDINGRVSVAGISANESGPGRGGPGGFSGGSGGSPATEASPGKGPGGGLVNETSNVIASASHGREPRSPTGKPIEDAPSIYGNPLLIPLVGGSGGGGVKDGSGRIANGGGGGGAILIASTTKISIGRGGLVTAGGGSGSSIPRVTNSGFRGGSGGAIRLVAPMIEGEGQVSASGVNLSGAGRIRIDTLKNNLLSGNLSGVWSVGANMIVFPDGLPTLRITHIAGRDIAPTENGRIFVSLPFGVSSTQSVRIQARGFRARVPIRITLYPESGGKIEVDDIIDNRLQEVSEKETVLEFPANSPTEVYVWTRPLESE